MKEFNEEERVAWERAFADRSGLPVAVLHLVGRWAEPCECAEDGCEGWQMGHQHMDALYENAVRAHREDGDILITRVVTGETMRFPAGVQMRYEPADEGYWYHQIRWPEVVRQLEDIPVFDPYAPDQQFVSEAAREQMDEIDRIIEGAMEVEG